MASAARFRPPLLLWRTLLVDQWILVGLTAVITCAVISFAATVKPLADGLLEPADALSFMIVAMPPMLAYALPFAAGFGTTLSYHRYVNENAILAAHAGGISHRSLLAPAAISGLGCAILLGVLNEQVLPRLLRSMEQMVTKDVSSWVVRSVEAGRPIEFGGFSVVANSAISLGPDDATGAFEVLRLRGVLVLQMDDETDDQGEVRRIVTAEASTTQAHVWLVRASAERGAGDRGPVRDGVQAYIVLGETVARFGGDISHSRFDTLELPPQFILGGFSNSPKYLTFGELRRLRQNPRQIDAVEQRFNNLAFHLAELDMGVLLESQFRAYGYATVHDGLGHTYVIRGSGVQRTESATLRILPETEGQPIEVRRLESGRVTRWTAPRAEFRTALSGDQRSRILGLSLRLVRPAIEAGPERGQIARREELTFADLRLEPDAPVQSIAAKRQGMTVENILEEAENRIAAGEPRAGALAGPTNELIQRLQRLDRDITSKQHERMAMAASCLVNVMTGAIAAMRLRHVLPLIIYLWSFLPALAVLLTISGGQTLTSRSGDIGLVVLWGGVVSLAIASGVAYPGLRRH